MTDKEYVLSQEPTAECREDLAIAGGLPWRKYVIVAADGRRLGSPCWCQGDAWRSAARVIRGRKVFEWKSEETK